MGTKHCDILPVCHALSGCDPAKAFFRLGRLKLWNEVSGSVKTYKKLCDLGENIEITPDSLATVEKLIVKLYGARVNPINKARYVLFCQKRTTGESLPPTDNALKFHVMRVNYQLFIWKKALAAKPTIPPLTPLQSRYSKVRLVFKERLHVTSDEIATADKLGPFLPEIGPFLPSAKLHMCET